ncbi:hypothetical protein TcasGA2_TC034570 [Tribolium castaneum]|uniref:Gustatory receptor n=1 Tax=Tribolium castaneum TaxID=7070 RepID=A0A139WM36_TRICA|nr:hypothetical protein TcasGA2_TC034570 [Tribolium castaneum]
MWFILTLAEDFTTAIIYETIIQQDKLTKRKIVNDILGHNSTNKFLPYKTQILHSLYHHNNNLRFMVCGFFPLNEIVIVDKILQQNSTVCDHIIELLPNIRTKSKTLFCVNTFINEVQITICGLFPLNCFYISWMVTAIATYVAYKVEKNSWLLSNVAAFLWTNLAAIENFLEVFIFDAILDQHQIVCNNITDILPKTKSFRHRTLFCTKTLVSKVEIMVCGLFPLSCFYITWMVTAIATYVIYLVQFSKIKDQLLSSEIENVLNMHLSRRVYKQETLHSLNSSKLNFMVCGLFPLNCKLVCWMIANIFTYVMYFIQFGEIGNKKKM